MEIAFPFDINNGNVSTASPQDYVGQLIEQILLTNPGERVNRPAFGTGANYLVFEPERAPTASAVKHLVQTSLQANLPPDLAVIDAVDVTNSKAEITITIQYTLVQNQAKKTVSITPQGRGG